MNTKILLGIGWMTLPLLSASAQREQPQINVSGTAEVKVAPDEVDLFVGVETRDENLEEAKRQNDERVSKALEFLRHNGIKDKDIQTDYITIEPVYDPTADIDPRTGLRLPSYTKHKALVEPAYYLVRKSIGLKLTTLSGFDTVLSGLITNGVNHVQRIPDIRVAQIQRQGPSDGCSGCQRESRGDGSGARRKGRAALQHQCKRLERLAWLVATKLRVGGRTRRRGRRRILSKCLPKCWGWLGRKRLNFRRGADFYFGYRECVFFNSITCPYQPW